MLWASVASLAFLVAALWPPRRGWLLSFGALVCLLAADDALNLHEAGPAHGVPELDFSLVYAILGTSLALVLIGRARRTNWQIEPSTVAFFLGGFLLAVSIVIDQAFFAQYMAEDGPKLLGTLVWLTVPLLCLPADSASRLVSSASGSSL